MENKKDVVRKLTVSFLIVAGFLCMTILFAKPAPEASPKTAESAGISLTSFSAKYYSGKIYLNWTVKSETDNYIYVIEKSDEKNVFKTLAIEESAVSPEESDLLYSVVDDNPNSSTASYKLYSVNETSKHLLGTIESVDLPVNAPLSMSAPKHEMLYSSR